jgi:hypothetical protein
MTYSKKQGAEMSIANLEQFVARENQMARIFKNKSLSLLDAKDRQKIADKIDCQLSPENLSCDGELSRTEVNRRYNFLSRCARELQSIDSSVRFYEFS